MPTFLKASFSGAIPLLVVFSILLGSTGLEAAELHVPRDFQTIQSAVDGALSGDSIIIDDGLYRENIIIKKKLILRSKNGIGNVVIEPVDASLDVVRFEEVSGATVTGLTIRGSKVLAALHLYMCSDMGIYKNRLIESNYGLYVEYSSGVKIVDNELNLNDKGLYLFFSDKNTITSNQVIDNTNSGILLHASHKNKVTENSANSNMWNGITLSASNENIVTNNSVINNTYAVVESDGNGNIVKDNSTRRRLYYILPVALVYLAIFLYIVQRKVFLLYFRLRYGEQEYSR